MLQGKQPKGIVSKLEKQNQVVTGFDYDALDNKQRSVVQQRTGEIKERLRRTAQDIWEIGQKLAEVRSQLKHGQFETWLKAEFGWSRRTAYNFINVYEAFGECANLAQIDIGTTALYILAAPSTPQSVRQQFLQRAKEGENITSKNLRQVIESEKSQPTSAVVSSKPPKPLTQEQESTTTVPQAVAEVKTPMIEVTAPKKSTTSSAVAIGNELQPGWYLLGKQHLLFCGDTASQEFIERIPFSALAIAITSDDWDHDWLIERAKRVIVLPESDLKEQVIEQLIKMFSATEETIILPWLPSRDMIEVAHKLQRKIFAGDPSEERCLQAIAQSGLTAALLRMP
ncbi:DUF3102 domain-containing protein [Scytonema sp. UIC 10036]|uniref:DUF3102 domain-containing protein n=1 Tax=Scytonema sp. UIC 10036 TaxID=2304196 RepID=UPI0012DAAF82|nr:DUF3102 domain-containing protein [Scytonema sp. UIC 10036]MUG94896.1 DUF3102 domain-containing protein [Scytonema sp. UIC 10036]